MKVKSESEVAQSCLTLSNPMDCSLAGSSIHGIFQARVLEWGAIHCVDDNKLWKILKELGDTKTPYLHSEKPVCSQDKTVKTRHRTMDWFKIGKRLCEGCILSSCLFNFYAEYIMWNDELNESPTGIQIGGRSIANLRYVDDSNLMAESEEDLKSLLIRVKEELAWNSTFKKLRSWLLITSFHEK